MTLRSAVDGAANAESGSEHLHDPAVLVSRASRFARRAEGLNVPRDRSDLRSRVLTEIDHLVIDVAVAPPFRRVVAFDDRVLRSVEVLACVAIRRIVAAPDMTALPAKP